MAVLELKSGVHWWTAAFDSQSLPLVLDRMGSVSFGELEPPGGRGHPGFRCHESGARLYCGSPRPDQPIVLEAAGEVCESWAGELVEWTRAASGWVTRVDLAMDVGPAELARQRLRSLYREFRGGHADTWMSPRKCEIHRSHDVDGGETLYLGGRSSRLLLRCYDRRGPLRLEFQYRPDDRGLGHALPSLVRMYGAAGCWRGLAEQKLKFPRLDWYCDLLQGERADIAECVDRTAGSLSDVLQYLRRHYGTTFFALDKLGVRLEDLAAPTDRVKGSQRSKLLSWADQAAEVLGESGDGLREALRCMSK